MAVEQQTVPQLTRGGKTYPLIGAYAMRDESRWSVFVLSRKLDGNHVTKRDDFEAGAAEAGSSPPAQDG